MTDAENDDKNDKNDKKHDKKHDKKNDRVEQGDTITFTFTGPSTGR